MDCPCKSERICSLPPIAPSIFLFLLHFLRGGVRGKDSAAQLTKFCLLRGSTGDGVVSVVLLCFLEAVRDFLDKQRPVPNEA